MSDEVERVSAHGDPIVKYCAVCGVEFDEHVSSNKWFRCDSCDGILQVKSRTEHELGIED